MLLCDWSEYGKGKGLLYGNKINNLNHYSDSTKSSVYIFFYIPERWNTTNPNRKAKFTPKFSRGEFGSFYFAFIKCADKPDSVGCRSPPLLSELHKLFNKQSEITLDLFEYDEYTEDILLYIIEELNLLRARYFNTSIQKEKDNILRQAKIILPESYLNMRTVNLNYATIRNIVLQRKHHRLKKEWQDTFCKWVTTLPYAKELIFCGLEEEYERLK